MEEELKILPCPFCGNNEIQWWNKPYEFYHCNRCGMDGPTATDKILAADRWNGLPRRLRWTREKPTVPEFYWYKSDGGVLEIGMTFEVHGKSYVHFAGEEDAHLLELVDGWWAGPIPEPEES